jgi:hypothetical protein
VRQAVSSHNPLVLILGFGALFFALGLFSLGGFVQLIWSDWAGFPAGHYSELFGTSTGLFSLMLIMAGFYLYTGLDLRMLAWPAWRSWGCSRMPTRRGADGGPSPPWAPWCSW